MGLEMNAPKPSPVGSGVRGFIIQASYRIHDRVPVVHLFGRLEGGETFLVRDRRRIPSFYVAAADSARAREIGATHQRPTSRRALSGTPVTRIDVQTPPDAPVLRDRLHEQGIDTFEADVRFAVGFLIDHNIRGGLAIHGRAERGEGVDWVFDDPEIAPAEVEVEPTILSFDIETDPKARRLLAISLYGRGLDEVYIVDSSGRAMPEHAIACVDEAAALAAFCRRVSEIDPDILTGWNVVDFDLRVLSRIAARVRQPLDLGREPGSLRIRPARGYFGSGQASIPGRLVLDGMDLVRGAFARFDDYSLETVSRAVLGEGKAVEGDVRDRADEIIRRYRTDLEGFALYARTDSRLALEIIEEMRLVPLALARSRLTGMQPDRVSASIASFDFVYLAELHKRGIVAPTVRSGDARVSASQTGGHVLEPTTGLHRNVWVFDFKSLYPSVMRTFNIDPLAFVAGVGAGEDVIRTATGAAFRRGDAILPQMLDRLAEARDAAKRAEDDIASQAIKILMNSFYGVLGTPACRFHNPAIANAITGQSRHFLLWSKAWFEAEGFDVLYGDTDSLFVLSGLADSQEAYARGEDLVREDQRRHCAPYTRCLGCREPAGSGVREALHAVVPAVRAARFRRRAQALYGRALRRCCGGVRRHGSGPPRLDRSCEDCAAGAVRTALCGCVRGRLPGPGSCVRCAAAALTMPWSTARDCERTSSPTRRIRHRMSPQRARRARTPDG